MIDRRLMDVYACPACAGTLEWTETEATCTGCATRYPVRGNQVDLHLQSPKKVEVSPVVRPFGDDDPSYLRRPTAIPMNPQGRIDCDPHEPEGNLWFGNGLTRELASWFPTGSEDDVVMDLGCGTRRVEPVLRMTGMTYLGTDVFGPEPDALCIAEALPLVDQSIDFIFALAVLPHVKRPWVAVHEIARVLKPGGTFIGTSQFLEPCDMQSRHHASALGVLDWLEEGGFRGRPVRGERQLVGRTGHGDDGLLPAEVRALPGRRRRRGRGPRGLRAGPQRGEGRRARGPTRRGPARALHRRLPLRGPAAGLTSAGRGRVVRTAMLRSASSGH